MIRVARVPSRLAAFCEAAHPSSPRCHTVSWLQWRHRVVFPSGFGRFFHARILPSSLHDCGFHSCRRRYSMFPSPLFQTFAAVVPDAPDLPLSPVCIFDEPLSVAREATYCCPSCGEIVVPRQGAGQPDHFEHQSGTTCPRAAEESLRWAAKQLIVADEAIALPSGERGPLADCRADVPYEGLLVDIEGTWLRSRRIAIMVTIDEGLDRERLAALARLAVSSMHIRLSVHARARWDWDTLRREALYNPDNRSWIATPY
jgi:hypothetical protein